MIQTTLYRAMAKIVAAWPQVENECQRPNTFAVVNDISDINADNLLKTSPRYRDIGIFFSRSFQRGGFSVPSIKIDYPAILVVEDQTTMNLHNRKSKMRFSVAVLDQNSYPGATGNYCENRTMEEQSEDMLFILIRWLSELNDFSLYDTDNSMVFFHALESERPADGFIVNMGIPKEVESRYIRNFGTDNVSGVFATIEITLPSCRYIEQIEFDWNVDLPSNYIKGCSPC